MIIRMVIIDVTTLIFGGILKSTSFIFTVFQLELSTALAQPIDIIKAIKSNDKKSFFENIVIYLY